MATANRLQIAENKDPSGTDERVLGEWEFVKALNAVYRAIEALGRQAERSLQIIG